MLKKCANTKCKKVLQNNTYGSFCEDCYVSNISYYSHNKKEKYKKKPKRNVK